MAVLGVHDLERLERWAQPPGAACGGIIKMATEALCQVLIRPSKGEKQTKARYQSAALLPRKISTLKAVIWFSPS